jgi:methylglyoxal synthase
MASMIALIAHDQKKRTMLEFVRHHLDFFSSVRLVATNSTGTLLHTELGLDVKRVASGPQGGDLMIGGRVAEGMIEAVIFFRDPLTAQPHEPDVSALMRVCDVHDIPLATNRATAESVVRALAAGSRPRRQPPRARRKSASS